LTGRAFEKTAQVETAPQVMDEVAWLVQPDGSLWDEDALLSASRPPPALEIPIHRRTQRKAPERPESFVVGLRAGRWDSPLTGVGIHYRLVRQWGGFRQSVP